MLNLTQIKTPAEFIYLPQTTSTMDVAAEYLQNNAPHLTTIFAEEQTLGRGRRGKYWHDFTGCNLALTVIVKHENAPHLPLITGLALHRALGPLVKDPITIKWPNDLKMKGRKLAGILVEKQSKGYLVGIGVNIFRPQTAELPADFPGIALAQGHPKNELTREICLTCILNQLQNMLAEYGQKGVLPFVSDYVKHCETLGQTVNWAPPSQQHMHPQPVLTGIAQGLTQAGALELKTADGQVHTITAGDIIAQATR